MVDLIGFVAGIYPMVAHQLYFSGLYLAAKAVSNKA